MLEAYLHNEHLMIQIVFLYHLVYTDINSNSSCLQENKQTKFNPTASLESSSEVFVTVNHEKNNVKLIKLCISTKDQNFNFYNSSYYVTIKYLF